eukprot:CAMPEP_0118974666 /NCGR_PEP_ID=MMETSP1173-20130426/12764_1 /TAXON_ID=1034831 /ORGANISM="Rhizochromulina marina cf, Strain CCMP1243" /LENGTH=1033 /DNA_ID=CAMNT_0006924443 /DNA_START=71 /DNA_END=3172 /DNA_ORIENTATION=+
MFSQVLALRAAVHPLRALRARGRLPVAMAASTSAAQAKAVCATDAPATHASFDIVRNEMVDEFGVRAVMYKHKKSGAEVLSVEAPDENKVFGITFRTPPKDSTGVPHILEHSVLCGSRKFTTKEPFVELLKGSLQTFLNAFTYPDRTCYPVASCNLKDFYNLINVYLDAVLHPRAIGDELVLQQEGWHLELESPEQPLTYKGVVYNEMKGVYSSPESRLARAAQQALFKDNTYGVDSGGDPLNIPDLTFDDFKAFHGEFYHPSNSRIFFYGDDPVPARLELLDGYLSEFDAISPDSKIGLQERRKLQSRVVEKFPAAEGEQAEEHMVQVNWLLNEEPFTPKEQLALSVLDHLLLGTSSSTLRKALTESGLGSAVIGGGLSDELSQATFSVGLKGVRAEDVSAVERLVAETLEKIEAEGVEESAVEASLNSMEFQLREFNTGSFPRGLSFMLGAMSAWIYDRDPLAALRFEEPLRELKEDLAAGKPVFTDMIRKLLLENEHRVTVEMVPDTELEKEQVAEEEARLAAIKGDMSAGDIDQIIDQTKKLQEVQAAHDSAEDLATIPALSIADLPKDGTELPNEVSTTQGVTVLRHEVPSNGIIYADVGLDLTQLPAADVPLVNLFARCLLETGTATEDEVALSRRIGSRTGGVTTSTLTGVRIPSDDTVATGDDLVHRLFLRGKAVAGRADDLFGVVHDVLTSCRLDNKKRIVEMLKESKARMESSLVSAGHAYAATRLSASHSTAGRLLEQTGGVEYLAVVKDLLETAESDWPTVQARLEALRRQLLTKASVVVNLSGDAATLEAVDPALDKFLSGLPEDGEDAASLLPSWKSDLPVVPSGNEGFFIPTQVNYVGRGGRLYAPGEKVSGSTSVVSRWLRNGYLWDTVRVIGGAYGGFCRFSPLTGSFSYLSYRDPNLAKTIETYDGASQFLQNHDLSSEALSQAIIGTVGDLDSPLSPDQKGWEAMRRHLVGETAEQRQQWRQEVLSTTAKDFKDFGERLDQMEAHSVVFGSKKAIEDANAELPEKEKFDLKGLL